MRTSTLLRLSALAASIAASASRDASASFFFVSDLSTWVMFSGGTPTQANLFNYLGFNFPTQVVPDTIFGDLGVTMHSSGPLVAHDPTWGGWYITPGIQGAQIEILFSTPQNAIYLNTFAMTPGDQPSNVLFDQSTKSYYSGATLLGTTTFNTIGVISSTAIDRIVVTVNNPAYIPNIGPTFYFVPGPGAMGLACCAAALGGRRRRRIF